MSDIRWIQKNGLRFIRLIFFAIWKKVAQPTHLSPTLMSVRAAVGLDILLPIKPLLYSFYMSIYAWFGSMNEMKLLACHSPKTANRSSLLIRSRVTNVNLEWTWAYEGSLELRYMHSSSIGGHLGFSISGSFNFGCTVLRVFLLECLIPKT